MFKAVFIDIDNTLLDFNKCAKVAMKRILEECNVKFEEYMFDVFVKINDSLWLEIEKGNLTKEGLYKFRWNTIFKELNIKLDGEAFEERFVKLLHETAEPVADANEVLEYLASKYTVYAASNSVYTQQIDRMTKADMLKHITKLFSSEKIGFAKPSKMFFDKCFEQTDGIIPEDVILIGDSLTADIQGGIAYGLKTCWFNYKGEMLPDGISPDYIVDSLKEIKDIL